MKSVVSARSGLVVLFVFVVLHLLPTASWAQQASELPPAKAQQFLELLNDPEVKAWLASKEAPPADNSDASLADSISGWEAAVRTRLAALAETLPRIPQEFANAADVLGRDVNSGRPGLVILILAVLLAVGFGAERLVRRALSRVRKSEDGDNFGQIALSQLVALLTFALASIGSFLLFEWPPLLRRIVLTLLVAIIAVRVFQSAAALLLSLKTDDDTTAANTAAAEDTRFWSRRIGLMAGFLFIGWATVSLMPAIGFSADMAKLTALLFGLGILATAIEAVWRRPDGRSSVAVRSALTLYLIVLWLIWVAGLVGLLFLGIYALVLPPLVRRVGEAAQVLADRAQRSGVLGVLLNVLIVRGVRAVVIGLAVAWLAYVFRLRMAALAADEALSIALSGVLNAIIVLLIADLVWQLSKALIAYRIEQTSGEGVTPDVLARSGRLRTLLPIFRNTLAAIIATVTVLTILAGMGVQVAPLIAGAGIFGVAIGFGSQTLVKDVLSGVFYMLDDAFRVGEYIQSGSYKGTVESFSLRSVRLRHHRGAIFTVPFGELGAVQNMSRDWVIDKMTIKVTYDSDVDLARKLIKKIGQELAADPEFAPDTIQPLKMQGIEAFGDFAIELKMKLMTKPNAQFPIRRRAFMMIKKAFAENGIKIAVPTVHVEGGVENAAAAQHAIKMNEAAAANLA